MQTSLDIDLGLSPPLLRRQDALQENWGPPYTPESGNKRKAELQLEPEPVTDAEPVPEPANGADVGVLSVHPKQRFVPFAIKTDATLDGLSKPSSMEKLLDKKPGTKTAPMHLMLLLDLSPSMRCTRSNSGADGLRALLAEDGLAKWLNDNAATLGHTTLSIAAFSGCCGWADQNHCPAQFCLSDAQEERDGHNIATGTTEKAIASNTIDTLDEEAVRRYCQLWSSKVDKIDKSSGERDTGAGTNTEAAVRFAYKAMRTLCDKQGGTAQVFLCTDGMSTLGETTAYGIGRKINQLVFDPDPEHSPLCGYRVQLHALMMGSGPQPAMLTKLLGTRGSVGYAKDMNNISSALRDLFEPTLLAVKDSKGTFDTIAFTVFENSGTKISETAMSCHSQGLLAVDNYTMLCGARVPAKFFGEGGEAITPEEATKLVLRVEVFSAPNLCARFAYIATGDGAAFSVHNVQAAQAWLSTDLGLNPVIDKRLAVVLDKWAVPDYLRHGKDCGRVQNGDDWLLPDPTVLSGPQSLFNWVINKNKLLDQFNDALGASQSYKEASDISLRFSRQATSSGHSSISRRAALVREATQEIADDDDPDTALRSAGEASHFASAVMSSTPDTANA